MKFAGSYPALITPWRGGKLDAPALRSLTRSLVRGGSSGLVPCGSTGEAATLTPQEYAEIIRLVRDEARGRIPVIVGVGANATWKTVETARQARAAGAQALLLLSPYYNKPTQEGIFRHFVETARSVPLPIVIYNIPGRTAVNVEPRTLARLAHARRNIRAVKEASGSLDQVSEILSACPKGFSVLCGDDSLTLPMLAVGARGVVSVAANLAPKDPARLCRSALQGDWAAARKLHHKMFPLVKALFVETNPIPVKAAAAMLGLCANELRLPLTPLSTAHRRPLENALRRYGLLR